MGRKLPVFGKERSPRIGSVLDPPSFNTAFCVVHIFIHNINDHKYATHNKLFESFENFLVLKLFSHNYGLRYSSIKERFLCEKLTLPKGPVSWFFQNNAPDR